MAELTSTATENPERVFGKQAGSNLCKSPSNGDAGASPPNPNQPFKKLVFVRYSDHVLYNRTSPLVMRPQTREAVGWLIYECKHYVTLSWDRDAEPRTLRGGDVKASGLVLLKSDILVLERLKVETEPPQEKPKWHLNSSEPTTKIEYALPQKKRKTQTKGEPRT
jgi:hypothetical protein